MHIKSTFKKQTEKGREKGMKKVKVLIAALLSATVVVGTAVPAYAATSTVEIEVKATDMNVSVTVPSTIPIVFNADGTNTLPTEWEISNESAIAGIHLSEITMDAQTTDWKLLAESENTKELAANTKSIKFSVGKEGALKLVKPTSGVEDATGSVQFENTEIRIPSGETTELDFGVERGAFTETEASAKAFSMVLNFEFN